MEFSRRGSQESVHVDVYIEGPVVDGEVIVEGFNTCLDDLGSNSRSAKDGVQGAAPSGVGAGKGEVGVSNGV